MRKISCFVLCFYVVIAILSIVFFNGTGDPGDSIYHYLFAKHAVIHPELFFDQWAKPVFVLLACPFAQFGFVGIKVFNAIVVGLTIFFTYKVAETLNVKNAILVAIIMIFTPLYYILTFSGLTEPLFALFVAVSIYLAVKQRYIATCLVLSFLPFVRSEGIIIIGVFAFYLIFKKQWKVIPLLLFGSILYSIAGYFTHHDLLWVINKIPYAKLSSQYGSGKPFHFVVQLLYVVGIPVYMLFWVGFISIIINAIKKKGLLEEQILIFLGFLCFFIAHSLFWYLGIFNSMGLKRVLIGVMPMMAIIALQGFNFITEELLNRKGMIKVGIQSLFILYILIFPFTHNPAAINWKRDMMMSTDQKSANESANFEVKHFGLNSRILCAHPYLCMVLNIDCFDHHKRLGFNQTDIEQMKAGDVLIWENWFAVVESGVKKEDLDKNPSLVNLYNSKAEDDGHDILYSVYDKK